MFKLNIKYPKLICLLQCIKFELNWIGIERKWIELELNWKILNLIWIGIELNWKILNPTWIGIELNWIERNELIRALSTTPVIDDSNRRPNKIWFRCSRESTTRLNFNFVNHCFVDYISINILTECLKFSIATHQNILMIMLHGNQYLSQNLYKNYSEDLGFCRHRRSFICREEESTCILPRFATSSF